VRLLLITALAASVLAPGVAVAQADVDVALRDYQPVDLPGVKLSVVKAPPEGVEVALRYSKTSQERRLLALQAKPEGDAEGAKTLNLKYRVQLLSGSAPKLALIVYDADGGSWYKVSSEPVVVDKMTDGRLSVTSLRQAAFSSDASGELEWANVEKVWVGVVIDGPSNGVLELGAARLTNEPFKRDKPLAITGDGPGKWSVGKDPAVTAQLTTPDEGPDGQPCMKFEFSLPGGRHMYAIPSTALPTSDLDGYSALQLTYRAELPAGIKGLLVMVGEAGGAQYMVEPMPAASDEWVTLTIPFSQFQLGGWTKDANNQLDLDQCRTVFVGTHGAADAADEGVIMAVDVKFLP